MSIDRLVEPVEPLAEAGPEVDPERLVLALEPGAADAEDGPAARDVVEGRRELGRQPRVAERVGADHQPEPDPARDRRRAPASTVQPSKIGCSHGPKIARRWSHVQTESQPAPRPRGRRRGSPASRSAATRAGARTASSSVSRQSRWSWTRPIGIRKLIRSWRSNARDEALGLVRVVGVVAAGHRRDVGLRGRLVRRPARPRRSGRPSDSRLGVGDGHGDPRVAQQVRRPAAPDARC